MTQVIVGLKVPQLTSFPGTGELPDDTLLVAWNYALGKLCRVEKSRLGLGGTGAGTATGKFTKTITVSLTGGKTMGTIKDGDVILKDTLYQDFFERALIETKLPSYSTASESLIMNAPQLGELGERVSNNLQASFNQGNAGNLIAQRIERDGTILGGTSTANPMQRTDAINRIEGRMTYQAFVNYAAGVPKYVEPAHTLDTRAAQVRNPNTPQKEESNLGSNPLFLDGVAPWFYGTSDTDSIPAIYGSNKVVGYSNGSLGVPSFGSGTKWLWFAVPRQANGNAQKLFSTWFRTALDNGTIGGSTNLFRDPVPVSVSSAYSAGNGTNYTRTYDLYFSNYQTSAGTATTLN